VLLIINLKVSDANNSIVKACVRFIIGLLKGIVSRDWKGLHSKKDFLKIQEYIHEGANLKLYIPEFFNFKLYIPEYSPI
jgi:hypothetical protein